MNPSVPTPNPIELPNGHPSNGHATNGHLNGHANGHSAHDHDGNHHQARINQPVTDLLTALSDEEKMEVIQQNFTDIMLTLGLDLNDDSLAGTPKRVAKMFVRELFSGLQPANEPAVTLFDNTYAYHEMLVERNIEVHSFCEHHFLPIIGMAHVAYIPREKVVGLSKLNRIVNHFARRPQVQERLTQQVAEFFKQKLQTPDVAVLIDAEHHCVKLRGAEDGCSSTVTAAYHGAFRTAATKAEFLQHIKG